MTLVPVSNPLFLQPRNKNLLEVLAIGVMVGHKADEAALKPIHTIDVMTV